MKQLLAIWLLLCGIACGLSAQAIGSVAPEKVLLSPLNTPTGVNQLSDYTSLGTDGAVVLLDWWGAT